MINRDIQQSAEPMTPSWHSSDARKINFVGAVNTLLLMGLLAAGTASAGLEAQVTGEPSCADKNVVFDGIAPLRYATVVGEQGSRIFLHPRYPELCGSKDTTCDGKSYLIPGDPVSIGKSCGSWAYIQFVGAKHVTTGWLPSASLQDMPPQVDNVAAEYLPGTVLLRYRFTLKRGRGIPVCEAFLQRLNITKYLYPPYCHWQAPLSSSTPGFSLIHRKRMTARQVWQVVGHGYEFLVGQQLNARSQALRSYDSAGQLTHDPDFQLSTVELMLAGPNITGENFTAWIYPDVDIENSGHTDQVMLWHGGTANSNSCTLPSSPSALPGGQQEKLQDTLFVMNSSGSDIDDEKTRAVFGDAHGNAIGRPFVPVGPNIDLFKYGSEIYFDSFMGDSTNSKREQHATPRGRILQVFRRWNAETHAVCTYEVSDDSLE